MKPQRTNDAAIHHPHRALAFFALYAALFLVACLRTTPEPTLLPATDRWSLTIQTLRLQPGATPTLRIRLAPPSTTSSTIVQLELAPPNGAFTVILQQEVRQETFELTVDLGEHFGPNIPSGTWRARLVDQYDQSRVLAEASFVILPNPQSVTLWELVLPTMPILAAPCASSSVPVEIGIRRRAGVGQETIVLYAVVVSPSGQQFVTPSLTLRGSEATTLQLSLCTVTGGYEVPPGSWTVRWYRKDAPEQPIAEGQFTVTQHPTPTPAPNVILAWQLPQQPVQPGSCDDVVTVRLRNATDSVGQKLSVIVQVAAPGREPVDLTLLTLVQADWQVLELRPCQVVGNQDIAGTWQLRALHAGTREPITPWVSLDIGPLPSPSPTPSMPPPQQPQPPPATRPPESAPPPPPAAVVDTDRDGLSDDEERRLGTDPVNSDTDGDGLSDGEEVRRYGTDPRSHDTDVDGTWDGQEILQGSDPFDPCSPWQFAYNCQQR